VRQTLRRTVVVFALLVLGLAGCNEHKLVTIESFVDKAVSDSASIRGKTQFDILWVVDNSNSMCQEQDNLTRNFSEFVRRLSTLDADFRMGVITTDVANEGQKGALQNSPAHDLDACIQASPEKERNYCTDDAGCGVGGCLCGVPHVQRCESDADCSADTPVCVRSTGAGDYRFCSRPCSGAEDQSCLDRANPNGVFRCGESPDHPGEQHCLLRTCSTSNDCPAPVLSRLPSGQEQVRYQYVCQAHEAEPGVSYCRREQNFNFLCEQGSCPLGRACDPVTGTCPPYSVCPAPTCDCPSDLGTTLVLEQLAGDQAAQDDAARRFRCMATVGTKGDSTERGLEAIELFLDGDAKKPEAQRFLRKSAHLVVVILSDEDDCSGYEDALSWFAAEYPDVREAQCPQIAERVPQLGFKVCDWYKERLRPVQEFSEALRAAKQEPLKVVVASIVGNRDLRCADACPSAEGYSCVASSDCAGSCSPGTFCAQRTFEYDICDASGEDRQQSCASENGAAFSGDRYVQFTGDFGDFGVSVSICQDSFAGALEAVAGLIERVGVNYCLSAPLSTCSEDSDCRDSDELGASTCRSYWDASWEKGVGQCVDATGTLVPRAGGCRADEDCGEGGRCDKRDICRWDEAQGGDPADLRIWLRRAGAVEGEFLDSRVDWDFLPDAANGCIGFSGGRGPGANDVVDIRYVSNVQL